MNIHILFPRISISISRDILKIDKRAKKEHKKGRKDVMVSTRVTSLLEILDVFVCIELPSQTIDNRERAKQSPAERERER